MPLRSCSRSILRSKRLDSPSSSVSAACRTLQETSPGSNGPTSGAEEMAASERSDAAHRLPVPHRRQAREKWEAPLQVEVKAGQEEPGSAAVLHKNGKIQKVRQPFHEA